MRCEVAGWFALLALASGCNASGASSNGQATGARKPDHSRDLHRPLHVPTMAPGAACPRTPGWRPSPDVAIALGSGPAYPVLGFEDDHVPPSPKGVVLLSADERKGGAYWHKTLWAVDPKYTGPVFIRGRRIDSPSALRFVEPSGTVGGYERQASELRMPSLETTSWRYGASVTILPGPGCYRR
jgi:hypothetical protein